MNSDAPKSAPPAAGSAAHAKPAGRGLARTLFYLLFAGAACGLIGEIAARAIDKARRGTPWTAVPNFENDLIVHDSLGTRGRPNGQYQKWKLNSAGFRSPESALTAAPGCTAVMTLGASETFGIAESPGKEFAAQLNDSLARSGCYRVLNAAIMGASVPGLIQFWNVWASRYRPDVVVILANPLSYLVESPPKFPRPGVTVQPVHAPWWTPRLLGKAKDFIHYPDVIQHWRVQRWLEAATTGHEPGWAFASVPADRLAQYQANLDSLIVTIRSHGGRPILTTYPMRFGAVLDPGDRPMLDAQRMYSPRASEEIMLAFEVAIGEATRELGRRSNTAVVDLQKLMNGKRELFEDAVHYTDHGAAIVAGEIARVIRDSSATPAKRQ